MYGIVPLPAPTCSLAVGCSRERGRSCYPHGVSKIGLSHSVALVTTLCNMWREHCSFPDTAEP